MNYIKGRGLFNTKYLYIDKRHENYYEIDKILSKKQFRKVKFMGIELSHPKYSFSICFLKVRKKYEKEIEAVLDKLEHTLTVLYGTEYVNMSNDLDKIFKELQQ